MIRAGAPQRARTKVTNQTAVVRDPGAFFLYQPGFVPLFVSVCGVYDVHRYNYVECVRRGLGCAIEAGR